MIYLNYSLIFAATALFFFLVILASTRYLQEKLEFSRAARYEKLRRFVSPQKLLMEQVFAALITACLLFLGQLTFGVEQMRIAIPVSAGFGVLAFLFIVILNLYVCPYRVGFSNVVWGSLLTLLMGGIASFGFTIYLTFGSVERLYGAVALFIVFLLWLYVLMICFVTGVILNCFLIGRDKKIKKRHKKF